jgi:hypothetical protein
MDKVALGHVFSEYFGLLSQFSFHQILHTHLSSGAGTIGQLVADVPSGLSLTPPQENKKKLVCTYSHSVHVPHPPLSASLPNSIWRRVQIIFLVMLRSPSSCHFLPPRFKHTRVHPVLKHPPNRFTSVRVGDQVSRSTTGNIMFRML